MSFKCRFFGSLNGWFVANVIAAILIALAMNFLFLRLSGSLSNPPLRQVNELAMAAGVAKTLNRIPVNDRSSLAQDLSDDDINISWFSNHERLPILDSYKEEEKFSRIRQNIIELLGFENTRILFTDSDDESWAPAEEPYDERFYALAIQLEDDSWLRFSTRARLWGLNSGTRWLLVSVFVLLSTILISWVFGLWVTHPMRTFARAVEQFGIGAQRQPLKLRGPIEIRETQAAFNAMQTQIHRLLEGRTAMFSAISHDLRAPLTRLKLRSEFVDEKHQRQKIMSDIDELQSMVEACLVYFQQESQPEEMTRLELSELLHSVVDNFRDMGKTVTYRYAQAVIHEGQPTALKRAMTNLIDNAVKYAGHADVALYVTESTIVITVQDEGPGVPPECLSRLFDPFYRVEGSRNTQTGGYGLGLAASRSAVHFHGGELTIANRQPRGLIATIQLPLSGTDWRDAK